MNYPLHSPHSPPPHLLLLCLHLHCPALLLLPRLHRHTAHHICYSCICIYTPTCIAESQPTTTSSTTLSTFTPPKTVVTHRPAIYIYSYGYTTHHICMNYPLHSLHSLPPHLLLLCLHLHRLTLLLLVVYTTGHHICTAHHICYY